MFLETTLNLTSQTSHGRYPNLQDPFTSLLIQLIDRDHGPTSTLQHIQCPTITMPDSSTPKPTTREHETEIISNLLAQSHSIPNSHPANPQTLTCCCGRPECAYILHNNAALDDLERNIHTAAQLGQVRRVAAFLFMI